MIQPRIAGERQPSSRIAALDLLRGLAVAGMILVANIGDWQHTYPAFVHAPWNGWTCADVVYPMFLFSVGMALGLSFPRPLNHPYERRLFWTRILRRIAMLVLLGLALNATYNLAVALGQPPIGPDDPPALRIPGTLQRIALCYGLAALIAVATGRREADGRININVIAISGAAVAILIGYGVLLRFVPVPGFGAGHLDEVRSWPAWADRAVFGPSHMYPMGSTSWRGPVTYDGEGLLGSLPATANVLFGLLAGWWWKQAPRPPLVLAALVGLGLVALGLAIEPVLPINKKLWTSSYAFLTGGLSILALVTLQLAAKPAPLSRLLAPLRILGANAVLAYVISIVLQSLAGVPLSWAPGAPTAQGLTYGVAKSIIPDEYAASLCCSLAVLLLIVLLLAPLHRRAIHFRL